MKPVKWMAKNKHLWEKVERGHYKIVSDGVIYIQNKHFNQWNFDECHYRWMTRARLLGMIDMKHAPACPECGGSWQGTPDGVSCIECGYIANEHMPFEPVELRVRWRE